MAQPTPYVPAHTFVSDSATLANFPGQALDVEFNDVKTTTDQIRANLALIQRDDGALANASVDLDQLTALAKAQLGNTAAITTLVASSAAAVAAAAVANADVVLTHADVVLTHADVVTTGGSVTAAAASAAAAAATLASAVVGPAASIDSEMVLFSGTTGKLAKRASLSGLAKMTSGVVSAAVAGTDYATKPIFVIEGDSHSFNSGGGTWPATVVTNSLFSRATLTNFSTIGDTAALMVGEYATQAGTVVIPSGAEAYFSLWAGSNDIAASTTAATTYGYLTSLWASARAQGFKVIAFTIMSRGDYTVAMEAQRVALNVLINSDATKYDFLIPVDQMFPSWAMQTRYFLGDAVHLTPEANVIVGKAFERIVAGVDFTFAEPADMHSTGGLQLNGSSDVSQYFGTTAITPGVAGVSTHTLDAQRVQANHAAGTAVITAQQVVPPGAPFFGGAFKNCTKLTATTAFTSPAAGDYVRQIYTVEGYDVARLGWGGNWGQPLTVCFGVYSTVTGTAVLAARNAGAARAYIVPFTMNVGGGTWEYKTITIPPDITGTWDTTNGVGLEISLCFLGGSTFQGTANAWNAGNLFSHSSMTNFFATNNNVVAFTGMEMFPGIYAPRADRWALLQRSRLDELRRAQRRLFMAGDGVTNSICHGVGISLTATAARIIIPTPEEMRATPTMTAINPTNFSVSDGAGALVAATAIALGIGGPRVQVVDVTTAAGLTTGRGTYIQNTNANARLAFDARL